MKYLDLNWKQKLLLIYSFNVSQLEQDWSACAYMETTNQYRLDMIRCIHFITNSVSHTVLYVLYAWQFSEAPFKLHENPMLSSIDVHLLRNLKSCLCGVKCLCDFEIFHLECSVKGVLCHSNKAPDDWLAHFDFVTGSQQSTICHRTSESCLFRSQNRGKFWSTPIRSLFPEFRSAFLQSSNLNVSNVFWCM